jgi:hypothetical protein
VGDALGNFSHDCPLEFLEQSIILLIRTQLGIKCLAAVWALRGILTPDGFKDFKQKDGVVGWDKEDLEELLDYVKANETPSTVKLLSANSRDTIEKGVNAVNLTRKSFHPSDKKLPASKP